MLVRIEGHDLPGRRFMSAGQLLEHVHVAVQVRSEPDGLVPGDAASATWEVYVRVVEVDDDLDFRGPAVHGAKGQRFLYLTWGDVPTEGTFAMFRRAKLMLGDVDPALVHRADSSGRPLVASVDLTDEKGCPRCARVHPPALSWSC